MTRSTLIRHGAYPLVFGSTFLAVLWLCGHGAAAWPGLAAAAALGIAAVAVLERLQPFEPIWRQDHEDTGADRAHLVVNLALLGGAAVGLHLLRGVLPQLDLWPQDWPVWGQVLLAGAIIDLGLYAMHRLSHRVGVLWRLHAVHHSAERLYWMNGERRHPLSALVLAAPGLGVAVGLGASPLVISAWLTLLGVHLAFQHANLDYTVGPLRHLIAVAEMHRWHHKRDYEDAQVNFGEFWLVWDRLFGTFLDRPTPIGAGEVGLRDRTFPTGYWQQLLWPFRR
jgi:sterol desaturase/sphingolipid hydroxylase (fatty acid hydroxylase superfamily)